MKLKAAVGLGILLVLIIIASCQSQSQLEFGRYYTTGKTVYKTQCQNCHGENGEGLGQLIPPLTDSAYLKNNKIALACAIQYGLKGKITISHKPYEGAMPANNLAPIGVAEVLTYITNSFGNKLGAVNADEVNASLANCK